MINIDDRIFENITESEFWLMCHIVKRISKEKTCFPSNKTLCSDTGWSLSKLQAVKKSCITKGLIKSRQRSGENGQTSNLYVIQTSYFSIHVNMQGKGDEYPIVENNTPPAKNYYTPLPDSTIPPCQKLGNEVLTNEVLTNEVNKKEKPENEIQKENQITDLIAASVEWIRTGGAATVRSWAETARFRGDVEEQAGKFWMHRNNVPAERSHIWGDPLPYFKGGFPGWLMNANQFKPKEQKAAAAMVKKINPYEGVQRW